jgi:hypothetical protein
MVEVCMCDHCSIDLSRFDREGLPIPSSQLLQPLILTAFDKYLDSFSSDQELAASDRPDTTEELDLDHETKVLATIQVTMLCEINVM